VGPPAMWVVAGAAGRVSHRGKWHAQFGMVQRVFGLVFQKGDLAIWRSGSLSPQSGLFSRFDMRASFL